MGSANQVPYSLAGNYARDRRRGVLVLAANLCTTILRALLTRALPPLGRVRSIWFVAGQNGLDDPSGLFSHSDSRHAHGFSLQQRYQPLTCALRVQFSLSDK